MVIATVLILVTLALLSVFQIAVALGAPLGRFVWGGQYKVLPRNLRIGSALAPVVYVVFGAFAISKVSVTNAIVDEATLGVGLWVMFAYFTVGIVINGISRSKPERYTMTSLCMVLAVCFFVLAKGL